MIVVLLFLLFLGCSSYSIVPQPSKVTFGNQQLFINSTKISTTSTSQILLNAINRFVSHSFPFEQIDSVSAIVYSVEISVSSNNENLFLGVDESYQLIVDSNKATLTAKTIYGALWGLETLAQLIDFNYTTMIYSISRVPIQVTDQPRFPWRGLLIDSARHYLEPVAIYRQIDALSANKMNSLHWHITDAQSFPIYSKTYPNLTQKGAYAPSAIYQYSDVQNIIQYAKERGVRVIPEFDIPGHAAAWGKGDPSLIVRCPQYEHNINNIPLDPTQPHTYQVVTDFLTEMSKLFIDNTLHLGGDEIIYGCWLTNPNISAWMKQNQITSGPQLAQFFEENLHSDIQILNQTIVVWEDLIDDGITIDKNYIVEVWKSQPTLKSVVTAGYRALLSAGWYLNQQIPNPKQTFGEYMNTWINFYGNDPVGNLSLTPAQAALILGGEACMWGEQADGDSMDTEIWPRAVAVGERLWSPQSVTDVNDATLRFSEQACRLRQRGIRSAPLSPGYCPIPPK